MTPEHNVADLQEDPRAAQGAPPAQPAPAQRPPAAQAPAPPAALHAQVDLAPIIQAVHEVMSAVRVIPKTGKHQLGYNYSTESDVLHALRGPMLNAGLVLMPSLVSDSVRTEIRQTKSGGSSTRAYVTTRYFLSHISGVVWPDPLYQASMADDSSDKAITKAITSAHKYFMLRFFQVETGEDSDHDGRQQGQNGGQGSQPPPQSSSAPQGGQSQGQGRSAGQKCRECGKMAVRASKAEYGGGHYCNKKEGGCGAKYPPQSQQQAATAPPAAPPRSGLYHPTAADQAMAGDFKEALDNSGGIPANVWRDFKAERGAEINALGPDGAMWLGDQVTLMCDGQGVPL